MVVVRTVKEHEHVRVVNEGELGIKIIFENDHDTYESIIYLDRVEAWNLNRKLTSILYGVKK